MHGLRRCRLRPRVSRAGAQTPFPRDTALHPAFADGDHPSEDGLIGCFAPSPGRTPGWIAALTLRKARLPWRPAIPSIGTNPNSPPMLHCNGLSSCLARRFECPSREVYVEKSRVRRNVGRYLAVNIGEFRCKIP